RDSGGSIDLGIVIHTVAYRLSGAGATNLEDIATDTGGTFNIADDEESLSTVLDLIELSIIGAAGAEGELDKGGFERCIEIGDCTDKITSKNLILKIWKN
ncbi:hypothetical protein IIC68_01525, partial [archaeon]|nr:hypothetical protein [archaeon]